MDHAQHKQARDLLHGGRLSTLHPGGGEAYDAMALAQVLTCCATRSSGNSVAPTQEEALAALALLAGLREWLDESEPRLVDAARQAGATWDAVADVLPGVADRRAAQVRRRRQRNPYTDPLPKQASDAIR